MTGRTAAAAALAPRVSTIGIGAVALAVAVGFGGASARAEPPKIALELNKLEQTEKGCRVYMVTTNGTETAYPTYQLDLVLFQPDGVIAKRIGMDIGPIKAAKRSLKLFDLDGLPCDRIGSLLVNEVLECKAEGATPTPAECLAGLTLSALGAVKIAK